MYPRGYEHHIENGPDKLETSVNICWKFLPKINSWLILTSTGTANGYPSTILFSLARWPLDATIVVFSRVFDQYMIHILFYKVTELQWSPFKKFVNT